MNILVTGGAGYVGSHACKTLKRSGFSPIVLDNFVYGHDWAVKWGPYFKMSLSETDKIVELLEREKISAVMHFAAYAYVGESVREPLKYYENNLAGSVSLLKAMQIAQVDKIVFSSSCATYGVPLKSPIEESASQEPINPYGQTKLMIEKVLQDLAFSGAMNSISLRYFNAAGADPEGEIGEDHEPETHLIPLAIEASYRDDRELTVFGTDYPTNDGTGVRDYIHVADLATAHVAALRLLYAENNNRATSRAYNLGTGRGQSVRDVIFGLEKITERKVKVKYGERRPGDPAELVASSALAQRELGWQPKHSSLEEILRDAVKWYKKHHLGAAP